MRFHPSLLLAGALIFSGGNAPRAQPVSGAVDTLAEKLRNDPKSREEAGKCLEAFLLNPDSSGKRFVSASADHAALGSVAREWGGTADAAQVAVLLIVARPKTRNEVQLRMLLKAWTQAAQIPKEAGKKAATEFLADAADKAGQIMADPKTRREIDASIQANDGAPPAVPGAGEALERAHQIRARQGRRNASIFGPDRKAQDGVPDSSHLDAPGHPPSAGSSAGSAAGGETKTPAQMAALIASLNEAHRTGRDAPKGPSIGSTPPPPVEFQSLGSVDVAPEPGVLDRASSLAARDGPVIAADLKQIRDSLRDAELPKVQGNTDSNPNAIAEFFVWLRTAKEDDMPAIDYMILPKGEVGHYELGLVSKGDIKVNHFIRNAPANARASVVVHELYHYWDKKVARNAYPNVSYGYIDPASKHIHEYDAYLATSLYWEMVKKEGDSSPLAKMLDRIPTDPTQVREMVNGALGGGK